MDQVKKRFIEVAEDPLPNHVWIIDTETYRALYVPLCDLSGVRAALHFIEDNKTV